MSVPHRLCWSCLPCSRCRRRGDGDKARPRTNPHQTISEQDLAVDIGAPALGTAWIVREDAQPQFGHQGRLGKRRDRDRRAGRQVGREGRSCRQGQQRRKTSQRQTEPRRHSTVSAVPGFLHLVMKHGVQSCKRRHQQSWSMVNEGLITQGLQTGVDTIRSVSRNGVNQNTETMLHARHGAFI